MKKNLLLFLFFSPAWTVCGDAYERFEENGKIGIKDEAGAIVLPASFDALGWSDGSFSVISEITGYRQKDRWGLVNLRKQFITRAEFETLTGPGGDRVVASKAITPFVTKYGCIDLHGKVVIPFVYDAITLHGLRAVVMRKNETRYEHGLIDLDDRQLLPLQYKKITPIGSLRYAVENFSGKHALCSEEGKWVTDFVIDSLSNFSSDLAIIYNNGKRGIIDRNGEILMAAEYRDIRIRDSGQVSVRKSDDWKILDTNFKEVSRIESDQVGFLADGWARATEDGKSGLADAQLKVKWPLEFSQIEIVGDKVVAKKDGKFRLCRLDRSNVIDASFDSLCVDGNFVRTLSSGRWELYDTFGIKKTATSYEYLGPYNRKFFPARSHGFWGGINRYGKESIACVYDSILEVRDEQCAVRFKGENGIIDLDDHWHLTPQKNSVMLLSWDCFLERQDSLIFMRDFSGNIIYFTDQSLEIADGYLIEKMANGAEKKISFQGLILEQKGPMPARVSEVFQESEGYIGIRRDDKYGFVDNRGRLRIANRYDAIGEFHDGLAAVKLLGKWGYINTDDQFVIHPTFEMAEGFDQGLAKIHRNSKSGLINRNGNVILQPRYDSLRRLSSRYFLLSQDSRQGLADADGRILIEPRFDHIEVLPDNRVIVRQNNLCGILTTDGLSLLSLQYDELTYLPHRNEFLAKKKSEWVEMKVGR